MKISFVIPAHNEEASIRACLSAIIRSIAKAPAGIETEIIVASNASTDATSAIARSFSGQGVVVVDEPRKGIVWARNAGYQASSGDLIANIDADTVMPEDWVASVAKAFSSDKDMVAFSGPHYYYDASWFTRISSMLFYALGYVVSRVLQVFSGGAMLQGGNYVVRRSAFEQIGGFDTSIDFFGEDTDVARRISKVGKIVWTFSLPMHSSGRRFAKEGIWTTGVRYGLNFLWITFAGKPFHDTHNDIRPPAKKSL